MQNSVIRRGVDLAAAIGLSLFICTTPGSADQSDAEAAIDAFDKAMLSIFHRGQDQLTEATRPVMVIARDVTVISKDTEVSYSRNAPLYQNLKSTSHVLLGIIGAVTPWPEDAADKDRWKKEFAQISTQIDTLLPALGDLGLPDELLTGQQQMLQTARSFVNDALAQDQITREAVTQAINDMRPIWAENMRQTARAELTALHKAVSDARAAMSKDDWDKMYILHHGGSSVKNVNVVRLYLERVMPEKLAAGQVLFAENAHGTDALAKHAGYVRMQRLVGQWAFGDPTRMEVDLLGYEAGAILDEMIPALPPLPSD